MKTFTKITALTIPTLISCAIGYILLAFMYNSWDIGAWELSSKVFMIIVVSWVAYIITYNIRLSIKHKRQ